MRGGRGCRVWGGGCGGGDGTAGVGGGRKAAGEDSAKCCLEEWACHGTGIDRTGDQGAGWQTDWEVGVKDRIWPQRGWIC